MVKQCVAFLLLFSAVSISDVKAENLLDNGSMDTSGGWRGDRKFVEVDGNRVVQIEAQKRRSRGFFQNAKTRGYKKLTLTLRYQTKDYQGSGLLINAVHRAIGGYGSMYPLKADGQWHTMTRTWDSLDKYPEASFEIELGEGEGTVLLDDITLKGTK